MFILKCMRLMSDLFLRYNPFQIALVILVLVRDFLSFRE